MKYDEFIRNRPKARNPSREIEHDTQVACVRWFRCQYCQFSHALFAVPNGGRRDAVTGAKMKAEGVLAGVSDLILLKSNRAYGALLIEMKTNKGHLSDNQKLWQSLITQDRYKYVVCHSLDEFILEINDYMSNT